MAVHKTDHTILSYAKITERVKLYFICSTDQQVWKRVKRKVTLLLLFLTSAYKGMVWSVLCQAAFTFPNVSWVDLGTFCSWALIGKRVLTLITTELNTILKKSQPYRSSIKVSININLHNTAIVWTSQRKNTRTWK